MGWSLDGTERLKHCWKKLEMGRRALIMNLAGQGLQLQAVRRREVTSRHEG